MNTNTVTADAVKAGATRQFSGIWWWRWLLAFALLWGGLGSSVWAVNAWTQTNGPEGGTILALALHSDGQTLFAGTNGGVFKSTNGGASWIATSPWPNNRYLRTLALRNSDQTLFVGTNGYGVTRSTDGGASWSAASTGLGLAGQPVYVNALALHSDGQTLFAGIPGGVYKSTNNGASWSAVNNGLTDLNVFTLALHSTSNTLFAGTNGGVFRSTDGGNTWALMAPSIFTGSAQYVRSLALHNGGQTIYASTWAGVYVSPNGGANWIPTASVGLGGSSFQRTLAIGNDAQTVYAATDAGGFKTTDGGYSWTAVNSGLSDLNLISIALHADGQTVFIGGDKKGVFKSVNAGSEWSSANSGLNNLEVLSLAFHNDEQTLLAGTSGYGIFKSVNGGSSWTSANPGLGNPYVQALAFRSSDQTMFAGTGGGIFKSTNGGSSWTAASSGLGGQSILSLTLHNSGQTLFAGTNGGGVFRSDNGGASWIAANSGLGSLIVRSLVLHSDGQTLFAGTYENGVFKSIDGGSSWVAVNAGLSNLYVSSLMLHNDGQTLFAGTLGSGVFKSTNGGSSWTPTNSGLGDLLVRSLALRSDGQTLFAGTQSNGVFKSTDGGSSWAAANSGMGSQHVLALALHSGSQTLFAGTAFSSVFKSTNGALSVDSSLLNLELATSYGSVNLSPAFNSGTLTYTATVQGPSATLTPTARINDATLTINGNPASSGNGTAVALTPGLNAIPIQVTSGDGTSTQTYTVNLTRQVIAPTAATNVQAVLGAPGSGQAGVGWIPSASGGTSALAGYTVTGSPSGNCTAGPGQNACAVSGLNFGTSYTFTVTAINTEGGSTPSAPSNAVIPQGTQTINFPIQASQSYTAGGSFGLNPASATSGLNVVYSSLSTSVCTVSGTTVTMQGAGTCIIAANQGGDAAWTAAPQATQSITIQKGTNTITFPPQSNQTYAANGSFAINPTATATSGLTVTYSSLTASVCTVSGTTVTMASAGTCTIAANQAGDSNWAAATQVAQNVAIQKGTNTVTFPPQGNQTYAANGSFAISPTATATSGLTVTYSSLTTSVCTVSGTAVTMVSAGTCTIAADQAGDSNWATATQVTQNVTVQKGTNTITFPPQGNQTYAANGSFAISPTATATSGLTVTYSSLTTGVCTVSGTTVNMDSAGICTIAADQTGDSNWAAATQTTQQLTINAVKPGAPPHVQATPTDPGTVTVTWTAPADTGGGITGYVVTAQPGGQTCTPTPPTATTCTFTGLTDGQTYTFTVEATNSAGSSADGGTPPAPSNPATPLANQKEFSAAAPTSAGVVKAVVAGGGSTCSFEHVRLLPLADASSAPPTDLHFPHGLLDFVLAGCDQSAVTVTVTYPSALPQGVQYWKLSDGNWAPYTGAIAQAGALTAQLTLRDGGQGDDDGLTNGRIVDPGQVAVRVAPSPGATVAVPTLNQWTMVLLAGALLLLGWRQRHLR